MVEGQVPKELSREQLERIAGATGLRVDRAEYLTSGAANHVFRLHCGRDSAVAKLSMTDKADLFEREAHALRHLAATGTVPVPGVLLATPDYLILEDLGDEDKELPDSRWREFGTRVGCLHQVHAERFGYEHDNYIGIWEQKNPWTADWVDFFHANRVLCFLDSGANRQILTRQDRDGIETLFARIRSLIPEQKPSLCHGDLWINNVLRARSGKIHLIDPAIHYGLPEADLAMTQMYGLFPEAFYEGYREAHPLLPDWKERLPLYQLKELVLMIAQFSHAESLQSLRALIRRFA